jgi:hypothetical protein
MKLTYRGVAYDYNPPQVAMEKGELAGRYRGLDWRFCNPTKVLVQQPTLDMVYRGVALNPGVAAQGVGMAQGAGMAQGVGVMVPPVPSLDRARNLIVNHQRSIKNRQQAMLTRLAAEVGLTARDAGSYWNRIQGKIHPSFRATYDRSPAALS